MACCAFAVLILINLLAPLGLRRLRATEAGNHAVAWRLGASTQITSVPRWSRRRTLAGAIFLVQSMLIALFVLHHAGLNQTAEMDRPATTAEWDAFVAANTLWCRAPTTRDAPAMNLKEQSR